MVEVPEEAGTSARLTAVTEIVASASEEAGVLGAEVIGDASEAISIAGDGTAGTRDQESPMCNLVAQMFAETLREGDPEFIGVQNPGGTRDSFDAGEDAAGAGSFLISGGDNFHVLADGATTRDTGRADLEAWVAWVAEQGTLSPDYSKRGVSASLPEGALVEGGAALTYTFGQPLAGGVAPQTLDMYLLEGDKVSPVLENSAITAYVGEVVVGTATVTDGVATIQVALPQDADVEEGDQLVRFEVADSGTEILVPVTVELADGAPVDDDDEPTPPVVRPGLPSTGN